MATYNNGNGNDYYDDNLPLIDAPYTSLNTAREERIAFLNFLMAHRILFFKIK